MATATKSTTTVTRTCTIGVDDTKVDTIVAAAKKVGAPGDAIVTTGGMVQKTSQSDDGTSPNFYSSSLTFTYSDDVDA